jgi:hypothetical protein
MNRRTRVSFKADRMVLSEHLWSGRSRLGPQASGATLFLCGDVMTGRGIDQVLPFPNEPGLHEAFAESALDYVELAERANGLDALALGGLIPLLRLTRLRRSLQ